MSRTLLDLCGAEGGATKGYQRAGWHVTAVDIDAAALKHNPADVTVHADALEYLAEHGHEYDAIHLSAPCQKWTANGANPAADNWPDLITPGRPLLEASGRPWVMENVPKAPLRRDLILCGTMFDLWTLDYDLTVLHLDRHRVFESNVPLSLPAGASAVSPHRCGPRPGVQWAGVYGGARKDKVEARLIRKGGYVPPDAYVQSALLGGVDWMTGKGRRECIPPVYAEHVGRQLLAHVERKVSARRPVMSPWDLLQRPTTPDRPPRTGGFAGDVPVLGATSNRSHNWGCVRDMPDEPCPHPEHIHTQVDLLDRLGHPWELQEAYDQRQREWRQAGNPDAPRECGRMSCPASPEGPALTGGSAPQPDSALADSAPQG